MEATQNQCTPSITIERYLRAIAGIFLIVSVILGKYHSENWYYFTLFIGVNLLQSSLTNWCPMMTILKKVFRIN